MVRELVEAVVLVVIDLTMDLRRDRVLELIYENLYGRTILLILFLLSLVILSFHWARRLSKQRQRAALRRFVRFKVMQQGRTLLCFFQERPLWRRLLEQVSTHPLMFALILLFFVASLVAVSPLPKTLQKAAFVVLLLDSAAIIIAIKILERRRQVIKR